MRLNGSLLKGGSIVSLVERRRWPRTPALGEIVGQIYTEIVAPVLALSEGGVLLEVPCVLRPRSFCTLWLALGGGAVLRLDATTACSYVHHLEKVGQGDSRVCYHAALLFIDISERDRALLRLRIAEDDSPTGSLGARLKLAGEAEPSRGAPPLGPLPGAERRDSGRINLESKVEGEVGLRLESSVLMLSQGGVMVRMPFAPQIGSEVSCSLEIDGQPARMHAIVRHANRESGEVESPRHVVGMEFLGLPRPAQTAIGAYVARRLKAAEGC